MVPGNLTWSVDPVWFGRIWGNLHHLRELRFRATGSGPDVAVCGLGAGGPSWRTISVSGALLSILRQYLEQPYAWFRGRSIWGP